LPVNISEPLRTISSALATPDGCALPVVGHGRWHVLFGGRQRPLLMPAAARELQEQGLRYFVGDSWKAFYARSLLRMNALLPGAGLLPEFRLPRAPRRFKSACSLPLSVPAHAAIQIGTSGPYQKASLLLMSEAAEPMALAKMAMVDTADPMVTAEAGWLRQLEDLRLLAGQVPRLVTEGAALNGRRYLVTTLAPSTRATSRFTAAHARFLGDLGRARLTSLDFEASPCLLGLWHTLAEIEPHLARRDAAALRAALADLSGRLAGWVGPFVLAQGDFAPWNIRVHGQRLFVFDWEYARAGANPLGDAFNYLMIPQAASGRGIDEPALGTILRLGERIVREIHPGWQWSARTVSALALAYLLEILLWYTRSRNAIDRTHPVIQCYWRLMEARSAWLAT
jgi:hypothetical protein